MNTVILIMKMSLYKALSINFFKNSNILPTETSLLNTEDFNEDFIKFDLNLY